MFEKIPNWINKKAQGVYWWFVSGSTKIDRMLAVVVVLSLFMITVSGAFGSILIINGQAQTVGIVKVYNDKGHGSGVNIGNGKILTAAHVVKDMPEIMLKTEDGKTAPAKLLWLNEEYDIALLETELKMTSFQMTCEEPEIGQEIKAIGNPMNDEFLFSWGKVSGNSKEVGPWGSSFRAQIAIAPGMSGGPVLDNYNNLVGIVVGLPVFPISQFSRSAYGMAYIVPSTIACKLLGRL